MSLSELLALESEDHRRVILSFGTSPCRVTFIQNPMMKDPKLILKHQYAKECQDHPCFAYHTSEDRRRPVFNTDNMVSLLYNPTPCPDFYENFLCDDVDACQFSHSQDEMLYHPAFYKTELCRAAACVYENTPLLCPYVHPGESSRLKIAREYSKFAANAKPNAENKPKSSVPLMNLKEFKIQQCTKKGVHDKKLCPFYHNEIDRRRSTVEHNYCSELCPHILSNFCPCDDNCPFSKNKVEQLYHPERYKKKFCSNFPYQINKCDYGQFCSFAHNEGEIRTELLYKQKQDDNFNMTKLKTIFCPFKNDHERSTCPYAHNVQDYRRNPQLYHYEPEECPYWKKTDSISSYEQAGCPKMLECNKCHGWKEYEFHSGVYKTRPCTNASRCQKKECAYFHSNKDKRY